MMMLPSLNLVLCFEFGLGRLGVVVLDCVALHLLSSALLVGLQALFEFGCSCSFLCC